MTTSMGPVGLSYKKSNNVFLNQDLTLLRRQIVNSIEGDLSLPSERVGVAVVNPDDSCPLSCPNCMYSAPVVRKKGHADRLSKEDAKSLGRFLTDAGTFHLVLSGGGEPFENLDAVVSLLHEMKTLEKVVVITSGYFATSILKAKEYLIKFIEPLLNKNPIDIIIRISLDEFHQVPIEFIENLIKAASDISDDLYSIRLIVRSILQSKKDEELAIRLNGEMLGELTVIDGMPTKWLAWEKGEIPIIYKPIYGDGLAQKGITNKEGFGNWRQLKQVEEEGNGSFNLSLRGLQGEGHNYYETVLMGYSYWKHELNQKKNYRTPLASYSDRHLCLYIPASGKIIINASSPDTYWKLPIYNSWSNFLNTLKRDPLQQFVVSNPTEALIELVSKVDPKIISDIDESNFVFAAAKNCLKNEVIRLYLTIIIMKKYNIIVDETKLSSCAIGILEKDENTLKEYCKIAVKMRNQIEMGYDPVIPDAVSIWGEHV